MAYTRGNLAVQERQKETQQSAYLEKTKVVKRRSQLPQKKSCCICCPWYLWLPSWVSLA